jgi:hypothetical protein
LRRRQKRMWKQKRKNQKRKRKRRGRGGEVDDRGLQRLRVLTPQWIFSPTLASLATASVGSRANWDCATRMVFCSSPSLGSRPTEEVYPDGAPAELGPSLAANRAAPFRQSFSSSTHSAPILSPPREVSPWLTRMRNTWEVSPMTRMISR